MTYWSERGLTPYSHPEYQLEGVWNRFSSHAQFWFPIERSNITQLPLNMPRLSASLGGVPMNLLGVDLVNPNYTDLSWPQESNESGQRLAVITTRLTMTLGNTEHAEIAEFALRMGESYPTYETTFQRKAVVELGVHATKIVEVYHGQLLPQDVSPAQPQ